jgi:signal transduction histidine kinase/CheY-like chemotaxis protein
MIKNLWFVVLFAFGCAFTQNTNQFQELLQKSETAISNSDIDNAFTFSKEALSSAFLLKDHLTKSKAYNAIGTCFILISEEKKAIPFFEKGINEAILTNNDSIKGRLYANLALLFSKFDSLKSKDYSKKALFFFNKIENNPKEANQMLINFKFLKSIHNDISKTKINFADYQNQISAIEATSTKKDFDFNDSKTIDVLLGIIICILLLLVFSLLRNNKQRDKSNKELEESNKELLFAKNKAEKATQLKSQFVSSITHELRTPLYGVVGITDIIIDEHKELVNSPHINSLRFSATYLLSLVNDLLQINKIEERKVVLESSFFNLNDEITTIANSLQFIANKNNNVIDIAIDEKISEIVFGDKLRLSQVFINLISNALKFTKNGQVTISANLARSNDTQQFITFCVKDTGVGIAKMDQEEIFEKFVQIERNEEDYQGTGLGLAIVKNLVEIFGGKIELESQERKGTTFFFTIPFEIKEQEVAKKASDILPSISKADYHVLVVEDNKINQIVTRKILEKNNFKCTVVDDGYTALDVLQSQNIAIVLMDINMPIINGYETTKLIRSKGFTLPIVALTAFDKQEVESKAISSGMNDVIIKPFDKEKLFQIISDMILEKK